MGLIIQAAKLVLCESCHSHGVIVYGDGSTSQEFYSIKDALAEIADGLLAGKLVEVEAELLRKDVRESNIPTEADIETLHKVAEILGLLAAGEAEQSPPEVDKRTLH